MIEISSKPSIMNMFNFGKYNGKTVADRFADEHLLFTAAFEILAVTAPGKSDTAKTTVERWVNSPNSHYILGGNNNFSHAAVGISCSELYCFAVMDFAAFNMAGT